MAASYRRRSVRVHGGRLVIVLASLLYVLLKLSVMCQAPVHQTSLPHRRAGIARVDTRWWTVLREAPLEKASR